MKGKEIVERKGREGKKNKTNKVWGRCHQIMDEI